jgi:U3 small nucleolar RNA-associated protein 15
MPSQTILHAFTDHTDYVRSGLVSPSNPALILTGSYDSTVRLWDTREGACVMTMRGGGGGAAAWPVEDVLMFPSGSAALSASGPILRVWDLVAGGRCVRAMSNHQKTVTALAFDGRAGRLLTGGLDQMVKVYDISTYKVVHTMKYPAPVLSLAISVGISAPSAKPAAEPPSRQPDDTHIAAGLSDGTLSVRRRDPKASEAPSAEAEREALRANTYEFFATGMLGNIGERNLQPKTRSKPAGDLNEVKIAGRRKKKLREYDRFLKGFKYGAALDSVLGKVRVWTSLWMLDSQNI